MVDNDIFEVDFDTFKSGRAAFVQTGGDLPNASDIAFNKVIKSLCGYKSNRIKFAKNQN